MPVKPVISVIIPTYNSANTIKNAIESILNQVYQNLEILIIDNRSTDDTVNIINGFEDDRVKITSGKDNGIYDAMNKGVKIASGEWLYFLGSDDTLFDEFVFTNLVSYINKDPKAKVFYGNVTLSGPYGMSTSKNLYDGPFPLKKLFSKNISHQAMFYHRSVFETLGNYNIKYSICADYDFNLRVASMYKLHYMDVTVANFSAAGASSSFNDPQFFNDKRSNILKYYKHREYKLPLEEFEFEFIMLAKQEFKNKQYLKSLYFSMSVYLLRLKRLVYKEPVRFEV